MFIRALFAVLDSPDDSTVHGPGFRQPGAQVSGAEAAADEDAYRRAAGPFYMPPGTRQLDPALQGTQLPAQAFKSNPPPGRRLTDAELNAMFDRVQYRGKHKPGTYKVSFQVELDKDGQLKVLLLETSSGIPELDCKTEQAIRQSAPFGPEIYRRFRLYSSMVFRKPERTAPAPTLPDPVREPEPVQTDPEPTE